MSTVISARWKSVNMHVNYQGKARMIVVDKPGATHYIAAFPWVPPINPERLAEYESTIALIAAAPELLVALKGLNLVDGEFCNCDMASGDNGVTEHSPQCLAARAAIDKAEGK